MSKLKLSDKVIEQAFYDHWEGLHRYAYTIVRNNNKAKDIVQQVFLTICDKKETIEPTTSLKSYLYKSVYNLSINSVLRNKEPEPLNDNNDDRQHEFSNKTEIKELQAQIKTALEKLPAQCQYVFVKNREEGKTYKQIADESNLSIKTIEAHMSKALKILRKELSDFLIL